MVDSKGALPEKKSARKIGEGPNANFPHCVEDTEGPKIIELSFGEPFHACGIKKDNDRKAC